MSDVELDEVGGAPSEGQTTDQAADQPGPESVPPPPANWEDDPSYRKQKAERDRREAELARNLQRAQEQFGQASAQAQAAQAELAQLREFVKTYDPDAANDFLEKAELDRLRTRLSAYEQQEAVQQQWAEYYRYHEDAMSALGGDPKDPEYQYALSTGNPWLAEKIRAETFAKLNAPQEPEMPKTQPTQPPAPAHDNVILPAGGSPNTPNELERAAKDYVARRDANIKAGDAGANLRLRDEYRDELNDDEFLKLIDPASARVLEAQKRKGK